VNGWVCCPMERRGNLPIDVIKRFRCVCTPKVSQRSHQGILSSSNACIVYTFQQDLVRKTGMRAVRQACGKTFEEVEDFLKSETFPVVSVMHVLHTNATFLLLWRRPILQPMFPSANANLRFSNPLIRLDQMA
jgi:hypothetical protein